MREPNLGATLYCDVCHRSFWSQDGISICSLRCEQSTLCECGNSKEASEDYCRSCGYCPSCRGEKEPSEQYCDECLSEIGGNISFSKY